MSGEPSRGADLVPPLKWAGGKRWLLPSLRAAFPSDYEWYFEPFVGGGAAFLSLNPNNAVLGDKNAELIATYEAIALDWKSVWSVLQKHAARHSESYYYAVRACAPRSAVQIAARFLYLNRTCWNGLYRVNLNGAFNVPKGTKDSVLLDTDNPEEIAQALQRAQLVCGDFEMIVDCAGPRDLIYADPPYTVKHNFNGFLKYNESIFTWEDQERLANALTRARSRGAFVVISNADHESIHELYSVDYEISQVSRSSVISGNKIHRGEVTELLIVGRPTG